MPFDTALLPPPQLIGMTSNVDEQAYLPETEDQQHRFTRFTIEDWPDGLVTFDSDEDQENPRNVSTLLVFGRV